MSTSAIGPVFDYLTAQLPAVVQAVDPACSVADGWINDLTDSMVVVGRTGPDAANAETGTHLYQELGAGRVDEQFDIPCYVDVAVGGDVQAEARRNALAIFNAIVTFVRTDMTFGGALQNGRWGQVKDIRMEHTQDAETAFAGRRCVIYFTLSCRNLY